MSIKPILISAIAVLMLSCKHTYAQSPTAAAGNFNIFIKGDASLLAAEAEGPVAIGGNLTMNTFNVNFEKQKGVFFVQGASIGLAVRGGVKLGGTFQILGNNYVKIGQCSPASPLSSLKVWFKDGNGASSPIRITNSTGDYNSNPLILLSAQSTAFTPNVSETVNPVCENIFGTGAGKIDIDGAFTTLTGKTAELKALADNLPILDQNGGVIQNAKIGPYLDPTVFGQNSKIKVLKGQINVLTVSAEVWNSLTNINLDNAGDIPSSPQSGTTTYSGTFGWVVNIVNYDAFVAKSGTNKIKFPSIAGLASDQGAYVIYNFPDATKSVTLGGSTEIKGTILAPQADVVKENSGNISGQIIAKSYIHNGDEIHFFPFLPTVPPQVVKTIAVTASSKCLNNAPYLDYNVTPNYTAPGEKAKIEWIDSYGNVIKTDNNQPLTGSILFPGAAVDALGNGVEWPGWAKSGDKYVEVKDAWYTIRNAGATIKVTVMPNQTISITYPQSAGTCYTSPPPPPSLPVTLASFTATNVSCNNQLKWTVTEAKDFSHFIVQRSVDAKTFLPLEKLNYIAGNKEYSYSDSPYSSESQPAKYYYYRLKQVDTDETFDYSAIRSVKSGECDARFSVDFYPNPTQNELNVKSYSPVKMLEILTSGGKRVYLGTPTDSQTDVRVNVQSLTQGLYIVNVVNAEGKYSSKILKK